MKLRRADRGRCADFTADILDRAAVHLIGETSVASEPLIENVSPSAHVSRLFLNPGELRGFVSFENRRKPLGRERIELFHSNDRDVSRILRRLFGEKVVVNLS